MFFNESVGLLWKHLLVSKMEIYSIFKIIPVDSRRLIQNTKMTDC